MRSIVLAIIVGVVAVCAAIATTLVIMADLPAGETAGKIALSWAPLLLLVPALYARRSQITEGTKL
jgi:hypothetical protein